MNDLKNVLLAWASSTVAVLSAADAAAVVKFISAIVLPVIFFAAGKAIDVAMQIYFDRRRKRDE